MAAANTPMRCRAEPVYYTKEAKQVALNDIGAPLEEGGKSVSLRTVVNKTAKSTNVRERALFMWTAECKNDGNVTAPVTIFRV